MLKPEKSISRKWEKSLKIVAYEYFKYVVVQTKILRCFAS